MITFGKRKSAELYLRPSTVVVLTTNHDDFDVEFIEQHEPLIVDLRNMVKSIGEKVYKL